MLPAAAIGEHMVPAGLLHPAQRSSRLPVLVWGGELVVGGLMELRERKAWERKGMDRMGQRGESMAEREGNDEKTVRSRRKKERWERRRNGGGYDEEKEA